MTAPRNPKRARKKEQRRLKIEEEIRQYQARRRKKLGINAGLLALVVAGVAFLVFQSRSDKEPDAKPTPKAGGIACGGKKPAKAKVTTEATPPPMTIDTAKTYVAVMKTSCGTIEIELDDEKSPNTVNSFVTLARSGFYDGLIFHRLKKDYALQGGAPKDDGKGSSNYKVTDVPPADFKYTEGVVAMAKGGGEPPGTSGSQFFIVPGANAARLPAEYAVLGKVINGDAVVAKINKVPTTASRGGEQSKPLQTVYIEKVTIRES